MKIFISYSWNNEIEADKIDRVFKNRGIVLTRDKRQLEYKQSIQDFMKSIRTHDYAILLISHDYLTSENCMYEFLEIFKEEDVMKKILPVILTDYFFDSSFKMKYIKYWNKKVNEIKNKIDEMYREGLLEHLGDEAKKLKKYQKISLEIPDIIENLQTKKMVKFTEESTNNFENIFKAIGLSDKEKTSNTKINLGMPKFEVTFKARNPIKTNKEEIKDNNLNINIRNNHVSIAEKGKFPLTIDGILNEIFSSIPEDWASDEFRENFVYKHNILLTIHEIESSKREFHEEWAERHPDNRAFCYKYIIKYNNNMITSILLVAVDGHRAYLPLPDRSTGKIQEKYLRFANIINPIPEDINYEYVYRAGLEIEENAK